ncbi:MAG TPA: hypothetical protein PLV42_05225 [bacterium]|nr:hypothetical protein [bacterium]
MTEKNLLIYENDSKHAKALKKAFEQFGFTVHTARSEDEMSGHLGSGAINLFIIRAENPNLGGFLLCKKIREIAEYRQAPIILLSSEATEQTFEKHRSLDFAADHYMSLPTDTDSILAAAHMLLPFIDGGEEAEEEGVAAAPAAQTAAPVDDGKAAALAKENETLRKKIEKLESESKKRAGNADESIAVKAEMEKLQEENEKLSGELGEIKEALASKAAQVRELEKRMAGADELSAEMDKSAAQIKELQLAVKKLEVELSAEQERLRASDEEKTQVSQTVEQLKAQLKEESERAMKGASVQAEELKKKYDEVKDELDDLKIVNKEMKDKVKTAEKDMEKMKAEHDAFLAEKGALEKKITDAEADAVKRVQEAQAAFEKREKDACEEACRLTEELKASYEEKMKPLQDELKIKTDKIEVLQAEKDSLEIDSASAKYKAGQMEKQHEEMKGKLEAAEKELGELRETVLQFSTISDERDAAHKERDELTAKLVELEKKHDEVFEKAAGAEMQITELQTRIEALVTDKGSLEKKVTELELVAKKITELEKTVSARDTEITKIQEESARLISVIEAVKKAVA